MSSENTLVDQGEQKWSRERLVTHNGVRYVSREKFANSEYREDILWNAEEWMCTYVNDSHHCLVKIFTCVHYKYAHAVL